MDAIEAQLARLTGQVEENANRIVVLKALFDQLNAVADISKLGV